VYPVRRILKDGARYFGPYSSASAVRRTLKLLRRLFPYLSEPQQETSWIFPHPLFAASEQSAAGTVVLSPDSPIDREQYLVNIQNIIRFLEGKRETIMATLREGMTQAAREQAYERAALWRDQLEGLERLEGSQKVYLPKQESFDVISIVTKKSKSAANVFSVRGGKLLQKNTFLLRHRSAASTADVLRQFILQYYRVAQDIPSTILVPETLTDQAAVAAWINTEQPPTLLVPQRGKKRQLLTMGELNAEQLLMSEERAFEQAERLRQATAQLAALLQIGEGPLHRIETYDISNIQGSLATGSMVVFIDGSPSKQHYKKFRIRLNEALTPGQQVPNDFAMLQEVLERRFSQRHSDWTAPDLIIIDGGKGQLSAAVKVLTDLGARSPVMSLAKREEEIFVPGQKEPLRLPFDSEVLYLLQRMRDEAHRFTISYHRLLRSKRASRSLLDDIPGIGPKLKKKLLQQFGSVKGIRAATDEELTAILGPAKTKTLQDYL
ncbi:MAG: excinuclease ABC subunit UvrC, partial [Candidatus Andersenbacteria bacterium]